MKIFTNDFTQNIVNGIELKISNSGYAESGREWKGIVRNPPYSRLYFIVSGDPYIITDKAKIALKKNFVYLIPRGMSYQFACDTSMMQLFFHITLFNEREFDLLENCTNYIEQPVSEQELNNLIELYKNQDLLDALYVKEKIYSWVIRLLKNGNNLQMKNKVYSDCVSRAISYIHENPSVKINVQQLCEIAFTSESNLTKKFKKELGISIGKYIDNLILYKAEQLLLKSDMSIAQISDALGFCDQFYFCRKFKSAYQISPFQYRRTQFGF